MSTKPKPTDSVEKNEYEALKVKYNELYYKFDKAKSAIEWFSKHADHFKERTFARYVLTKEIGDGL